MKHPIYKFLKENGLTQKDEVSFLQEYSNPEKSAELHKFLSENGLTTKSPEDFYNEYFTEEKKNFFLQSSKESTAPQGQRTEPSATSGGLDYTRPKSTEKRLYGEAIGGIVESASPLQGGPKKEKPKQPPMDVTYRPEGLPSETTQAAAERSTPQRARIIKQDADNMKSSIEKGEMPNIVTPELQQNVSQQKIERQVDEVRAKKGMPSLEEEKKDRKFFRDVVDYELSQEDLRDLNNIVKNPDDRDKTLQDLQSFPEVWSKYSQGIENMVPAGWPGMKLGDILNPELRKKVGDAVYQGFRQDYEFTKNRADVKAYDITPKLDDFASKKIDELGYKNFLKPDKAETLASAGLKIAGLIPGAPQMLGAVSEGFKEDLGLTVVDMEKVESLANDIANQMGASDSGYVKELIRSKLVAKLENEQSKPKAQAILNEGIGNKTLRQVLDSPAYQYQEAVRELKAQTGKAWDMDQSNIDINARAKLSLDSAYESIQKQAKDEQDLLLSNYYSQIELAKQGLAQAPDPNDVNQQISEIYTKAERNWQNQQDAIFKNANRELEAAYKKFTDGYNADPKILERMQTAYSDALTMARRDMDKKRDVLIAEKGLPLSTLGRSYMTALGGSIKGYGGAFDNDVLKFVGQALEQDFKIAPAETKNWSDLLEGDAIGGNFQKLTGMLGGSMTTGLLVSGITAAATGGTGIVPAISAGISSFLAETADIAGRNRNAVLEKTGSESAANKAYEDSWRAQFNIAGLYAFEGLPWIGKGIKAIKTLGGRMAVGAIAEYVPEYFQEFTQGIHEENIQMGNDPWLGFSEHLRSPQRHIENAITLTPTLLFGAAGQARSKTAKQEAIDAYTSMAAKEELAKVLPDLKKQWIHNMVMDRGGKFAKGILSTMHQGGQISKEEFAELNIEAEIADQNVSTAKESGLKNKSDINLFSFLSRQANNARKLADKHAETNPGLSKFYEEKYKKYSEETAKMLNGETPDIFTITYADGSQSILTSDEAKTAVKQDGVLQGLKDGTVSIESYKKDQTQFMDELRASVDSRTQNVESLTSEVLSPEVLLNPDRLTHKVTNHPNYKLLTSGQKAVLSFKLKQIAELANNIKNGNVSSVEQANTEMSVAQNEVAELLNNREVAKTSKQIESERNKEDREAYVLDQKKAKFVSPRVAQLMSEEKLSRSDARNKANQEWENSADGKRQAELLGKIKSRDEIEVAPKKVSQKPSSIPFEVEGMPSETKEEAKTEQEEVRPEAEKTPSLEIGPVSIGVNVIEPETIEERKNKVLEDANPELTGLGGFSQSVGMSETESVPVGRNMSEGKIETVQYANPKTGDVDLIISATPELDYVAYIRVYENGKPTNKWTTKMQSKPGAGFSEIVAETRKALPQGHEWTETTSVSTDGLRVFGKGLQNGYEIQYDESGNPITNKVEVNAGARSSKEMTDAGVEITEVDKEKMNSIRVNENDDTTKNNVKNILLPYLSEMGLDESNIYFEDGKVYVDLPVLKESKNPYYDQKDQTRISGQVGVGQESVETKPIETAGEEAAPTSGVLQTQEEVELKPSTELPTKTTQAEAVEEKPIPSGEGKPEPQAEGQVEEKQNKFQYLVDKTSTKGASTKGSATKTISLSSGETATLNKTLDELEKKAVNQNSATFDEAHPTNANYEKINGKEQKINVYKVDGHEIRYVDYGKGRGGIEITTPQGDLLIVKRERGTTTVAKIPKTTPSQISQQQKAEGQVKEAENLTSTTKAPAPTTAPKQEQIEFPVPVEKNDENINALIELKNKFNSLSRKEKMSRGLNLLNKIRGMAKDMGFDVRHTTGYNIKIWDGKKTVNKRGIDRTANKDINKRRENSLKAAFNGELGFRARVLSFFLNGGKVASNQSELGKDTSEYKSAEKRGYIGDDGGDAANIARDLVVDTLGIPEDMVEAYVYDNDLVSEIQDVLSEISNASKGDIQDSILALYEKNLKEEEERGLGEIEMTFGEGPTAIFMSQTSAFEEEEGPKEETKPSFEEGEEFSPGLGPDEEVPFRKIGGPTKRKGATMFGKDAAKKVAEFLKASGIKVIVLSEADYNKRAAQEGFKKGAQGVFISKKGEVIYNEKDLNEGYGDILAFHEGIHPVINIIRNTNPALYQKLVEGINKEAKSNKKLQEIAAETEEATQGESKLRKEDELVVETLARIAGGDLELSKLTPSLKEKVIAFMNKIGELLGIGKIKLNSPEIELREFAKKLSDAIMTGSIADVVGEENVNEYASNLSMQPSRILNVQPISNIVNFVKNKNYRAAKTGNPSAAKTLINEVLNDKHKEKIKKALQKHPDAEIVPVRKLKETGTNRIPNALAEKISSLSGNKVNSDIVQYTESDRTNQGKAQRFFERPDFQGDVKKGAKYILVDDAFATGGTIKALKDYIEDNGGDVVNVVVLGAGRAGTKFEPTKIDKKILTGIFGKKNLDILLDASGRKSIENLTKEEIEFLKEFDSVSEVFAKELAQRIKYATDKFYVNYGKTKNGLTITTSIEGSFASESGNDQYSRIKRGKGPVLAAEKELSVRAVWNKNKTIKFNGSVKVNDASDVAHIMRQLENKAVENAFAVHIDKNGKPHIQYLGMGTGNSVIMDPYLVLAGAKRYNSKKIYLVHNHPSGRMEPSNADIQLTADTAKSLKGLNIELEHIILDTYKKEYVHLYEDGVWSKYGRDLTKETNEKYLKTLKVEALDEFEVLTEPVQKIKSSQDAATVFTQARFTALPKRGMLVLDNANYVVGNFVLPNGFNYDDVVQNMAEVGVKPSVIFYSNQNDYNSIKEIKKAIESAKLLVLDFIVTNSAGTGVQGYYESYADEGKLWETQEEYGTNSISPDIQPSAIQRGKMTVRGQEVEVRPLPEGTEVVNGFYSPIEKNLRETKAEKQSANKWLTSGLIGKGDEAVYTGVKGWLEAKNPQEQVSKQDILDFMRDNRVQIVEVVKREGAKPENYVRFDNIVSTLKDRGYDIEVSDYGSIDMNIRVFNTGGPYLTTKDDYATKEQLIEEGYEVLDTYEEDVKLFQEAKRIADDIAYRQQKDDTSKEVKFSQYQLEGEKSNYKEVLVTLPSKNPLQQKVLELEKIYEKDGSNYNLRELENAKEELKKSQTTSFRSSHFEEPNILVHLRMNTRADADGSKVLFLEEVQSDWGQKGKKEGFADKIELTKEEKEEKIAINERINAAQPLYNRALDLAQYVYGPFSTAEQLYNLVKMPLDEKVKLIKSKYKERLDDFELGRTKDNQQFVEKLTDTAKKVYEKQIATANESFDIDQFQKDNTRWHELTAKQVKSPIPPAPFVTDTNAWTKLGLKFALQEAVRQGADKIAWTTGEQQNERYDLAKTFDRIVVDGENGVYEVYGYKDGKKIMEYGAIKEKDLPDYIGKELADKAIKDGGGDYKGLDLKVGGKGMIGFYGSVEQGKEGIVGGVAKALVKELTGKPTEIGETKIETQKQDVILTENDFDISEAPSELKDLLDKYEDGISDGDYNELQKLSNEALSIGYEIDYDLDGTITSFKRVSGKPIQSTQSSIDITPELEAAVERGMPQFSRFKRGSMSSEQARTEMGGMLKEAYRQIKEEGANPQSTYDAIFETDQYRSLTPEQRTILHDSIRYFHPDVTTATKDTQNITHVDIKEQSAVLETLKSDRDLAYIYRNFPKIVKQLKGKGIIETKGDCI